MLPVRHRDDTSAGKYADSAIPALLTRLAGMGGAVLLQACSIGGAQMFPLGSQALASIGDQTWRPRGASCGRAASPSCSRTPGGKSGRTVVYDNATGQVSVKTLTAFQWKGETS